MVTITSDHVRRVKEAVNLKSLVESYGIKLRQSSADSFIGLCPVHKEKTNSYLVHPKAGYCKCFGCGASHDALSFVQAMDGISFPAAVRQLADQYGVSLDGPRVDAATARRQRDAARRIAAEASWWWGTVTARYHERQAFLVRMLTHYSDLSDGASEDGADSESLYQHYARRAWRFVRAVRRIDAVLPVDVMGRWLKYKAKHPGVMVEYREYAALDKEIKATWERIRAEVLAGRVGDEQMYRMVCALFSAMGIYDDNLLQGGAVNKVAA